MDTRAGAAAMPASDTDTDVDVDKALPHARGDHAEPNHGGQGYHGGRAERPQGPLRPGKPGVAQSEPTQFSSSCAPASPDFSGWNWVAESGPFSTAATNREPWVAHVTSGGRNGPSVSSSQRCTP